MNLPGGARRLSLAAAAALLMAALAAGCDGNPADRAGIGAQCANEDQCFEDNQSCLTTFKGGYCGVMNCLTDASCPDGSACVSHSDGVNYCFRLCADKVDCNAHRSVANESNCVGSVDFADPNPRGAKACVPPSSGL